MWSNPRKGGWSWRKCLWGMLAACCWSLSFFCSTLLTFNVFLAPFNYSIEIRLISPSSFSSFFFFLVDSWGASKRFSPSLSALSVSKRFSPKDIFIFIFIFLWSRDGWSRDRALLHYEHWFIQNFNELLLGKGLPVDFQSMPVDEHGDGFLINVSNKD